MRIVIESIPVESMRIPGSLGDYWYDKDGALQVRVAEMGSVDYQTLIAVHEVVEEWLTKRRGLTEPEIQAFDEKWTQEWREGKHRLEDEPGFAPNAPYGREHTLADAIERMLVAFAGISMSDYEAAVERLLSPTLIVEGKMIAGL